MKKKPDLYKLRYKRGNGLAIYTLKQAKTVQAHERKDGISSVIVPHKKAFL